MSVGGAAAARIKFCLASVWAHSHPLNPPTAIWTEFITMTHEHCQRLCFGSDEDEWRYTRHLNQQQLNGKYLLKRCHIHMLSLRINNRTLYLNRWRKNGTDLPACAFSQPPWTPHGLYLGLEILAPVRHARPRRPGSRSDRVATALTPDYRLSGAVQSVCQLHSSPGNLIGSFPATLLRRTSKRH